MPVLLTRFFQDTWTEIMLFFLRISQNLGCLLLFLFLFLKFIAYKQNPRLCGVMKIRLVLF